MDKPIVVPESLDGLSDKELSELGAQIREQVEGLADEARTNDEALATVEGLIADYDKVNQVLGEREVRAGERNAAVDSALGRFAEPAAEEGEAEGDDVVTDEAPAVDQVAAASNEDSEELAADEDATDEAAAEDAEELATDEVEELSTDDEATEEAATEDVTEAATDDDSVEEAAADAEEFAADDDDSAELATKSAEEAASKPEEGTKVAKKSTTSRLRDRRPEALEPKPEAPAGASLQARNIGGAVTEGQTIDIATLATAIVDKRIAMGNVPSGTFEYVTLASAMAEYGEDVVGGGAQENFGVLSRLATAHRERVEDDTALVASGGVCAPLEQNYDFFRLAEEMNPVERAIPVAQSSRAGIRYIQPPDFRDAAPGVRVTTEDEDAAGYESQGGPTPDKPCVAVTCPPIQECRVDAVSKCVTFGNLNYRVFPEQVQAFLADLAVIFTETKEIFYLDAIDAASTPVTSVQTYSAVRTLIYDLLAASANYRRRHHMDPNSTLQVFLPSWLPELLKVDMVNDHALGLNFIDADMTQVNSFFAKANLDVSWYYDSATGAGQAFNGPQGVGDLNSFPGSVVSYLFAPGTFVRLDAGTLDLGIVRDHILNGTNDLQIFAEQWIQVCMIGLESLRIEHTLCPTGTAPEPVTPLECPTGES